MAQESRAWMGMKLQVFKILKWFYKYFHSSTIVMLIVRLGCLFRSNRPEVLFWKTLLKKHRKIYSKTPAMESLS